MIGMGVGEGGWWLWLHVEMAGRVVGMVLHGQVQSQLLKLHHLVLLNLL